MGKTGKVYLIGAGPGDPGLITVRGKELLYSCDAVLYDNLVCPEFIIAIPKTTEKYYVGKKAGDHPVPQEKINELLLKLAREGKSVARLKGSDPLIFGRGGEEAKYLKEHGVEFEIITGVTSGIAGPAYAGIPCTDRMLASSVLFLTGHKSSDKLKSTVPWDWVAKIKNGTVVIYMGVNEISNITSQLIEYGMNSDTSAAIVERGTFPSQRVFTATLKNLPGIVKNENVRPPALFVLGEVVNLQPYLEWFADRPLLGLRVLVTRASAQAGDLYRRLRELGAEPLPYPTIAARVVDDVNGWTNFSYIQNENKWLIFTSENGVRYFMDSFFKKFDDIRMLAGFKIAAIGAGTSKLLKEYRLPTDYMPSKATVNILVDEMPKAVDLKGAAVVRVRGNLADDLIEKAFPGMGAEVVPLTTYETYYPKWPDGLKEKLIDYPPDAILFTSGSTKKGLYHNLSKDEVDKIIQNAKVFSIGPKASAVLKSEDVNITREAKVQNIAGLLDELVDYYSEK
ncbi:MAG: uroporphyrinogen-III C-methyltransferase [candidate division Zixibacteria bacterium]